MAKLAEKLAELDGADEISAEASEAHLKAIQEILTDEQKEVLSAIELPRPAGQSAAGGGMGAGGPPGGGGGGGGGGTPMPPPVTSMSGYPMPPGASMSKQSGVSLNPFHQQENQKRLRDLRERLGGASQNSP
jgi:hypothetical protein